jgi:hypothetical protein
MNNNLEFENESPHPDKVEDNHPRTNYGEGYNINKLEELQMDAITSAEFNPEDKVPNYLGFAKKSGELTTDIAIKFGIFLGKRCNWVNNSYYSYLGKTYSNEQIFKEFISNHYGK